MSAESVGQREGDAGGAGVKTIRKGKRCSTPLTFSSLFYSAECVEGAFCELRRLDGVLGRTA
jgi:hypothetical protein